MNNFSRAHNQYLEPPDEPEAVFCDSCGEEMKDGETCKYQYCPARFTGDAREMAELLIGATEEIKALARKLKMKTRELDRVVEAYSNSGLE